ncbi:MAG: transcription initiation factor IIB [Nitrosotalea sp.]
MNKISTAKQTCTNCKNGTIISDTNIGELVCEICGHVTLEQQNNLVSERVASYDDVEKIRTGMPFTLARHDMGLSTIIGYSNTDASGRPLSASMKATMVRLRMWNNRTQINRGLYHSLQEAFNMLDRLKDSLSLSYSVIEKSAYIYRKALDKGLTRGRSISGILAAAVYVACKDTETPRSMKEISKGIDVNKKVVARCYGSLINNLDLVMPITDPMKFVPAIASRVKINEKTKRKALGVLKVAKDSGISMGKNPAGFAASALYLSSVINGDNITQKTMASASGISEVTLRAGAKSLQIALKNNLE